MLYQDLHYPLANYPLGVPELWDSGQFYACHEYLETAWMQTPVSQAAQRHLLQGLLQVAVAFHHQSVGNAHGFQVLLSKGVAHLEQSGVAEAADKHGCHAESGDWVGFLTVLKQLLAKNP